MARARDCLKQLPEALLCLNNRHLQLTDRHMEQEYWDICNFRSQGNLENPLSSMIFGIADYWLSLGKCGTRVGAEHDNKEYE